MKKMEYRRKFVLEVLGWNKNHSSPDYYIKDCTDNQRFEGWYKLQIKNKK